VIDLYYWTTPNGRKRIDVRLRYGNMTLYAIGYTLVLFLASLFAGIAAASRRVLAHSDG
jgi:cytochrome c biogenesis protein CcdA